MANDKILKLDNPAVFVEDLIGAIKNEDGILYKISCMLEGSMIVLRPEDIEDIAGLKLRRPVALVMTKNASGSDSLRIYEYYYDIYLHKSTTTVSKSWISGVKELIDKTKQEMRTYEDNKVSILEAKIEDLKGEIKNLSEKLDKHMNDSWEG